MTDEKKRDLGLAQHEFKRNYQYRVLKHNVISEAVTMILIGALVVSLGFMTDASSVKGNGMEPSIKDGQHVVVNKLAYEKRMPVRGDIVSSNGRIYRIIGLPGDVVEISGGSVFLNGSLAEESYEDEFSITYPGVRQKYNVPDDSYFVLLDNRDCYDDSRSGMFLPFGDIDGKVFMHF